MILLRLLFIFLSTTFGSLFAVQGDSELIQICSESLKNNLKRPILYVPIGPSGSGKTTFCKNIQKASPEVSSFSFDGLRHAWYNPSDYDKAFHAASADPTFYPRAETVFCEMLSSLKDIYLDATNLNPIKRNFYLQKAKEQGYLVIGFVFSVDLEVLIARQATRRDKCIAEDVVRSQYSSLITPQLEEGFDLVFFLK